MGKVLTWASILVLSTIGMPIAAAADSVAEMLEQGIYNEDTVGNLDEAIKLYREVVKSAKQTEALAAKAQYRLGQCLSKQGKTDEALAAFETVVKRFPEQRDWVAKAKTHLPDQLSLAPAPWANGERLTLTMALPTGQTLGIVGTGAESIMVDGKPAWKYTVRRYVGAPNEGVSEAVVDAKSNLPIRTLFDHTVLGVTTGKWRQGSLEITTTKAGKDEVKTVDFDGTAYSNDQWFFGFRQLPMKIGTKIKVPLRVAFTGGNPVGMEVTVAAKETVETPVGSFEAYRVDTNISQTFWIADVPQRYIVKFDGGGVTALLSSISTPNETQTLNNEELGLSVKVPVGWFSFPLSSTNEKTAGGFQLVAPTMASVLVQVREKTQLGTKAQDSTGAWAATRKKRGESRFIDYKVREGSEQDGQLAGGAAKSFTADNVVSGRALVHDSMLSIQGDMALEVVLTSEKDAYDSLVPLIKELRKSVTLR